MNKEKLKENLLGILDKRIKDDINLVKFKLTPVIEPGKKYNSTDDVVRLWVFKEIDFEKAEYPLDELIKILSVIEPKFPLWINIDSTTFKIDRLIHLEISMRFRKPSQLKNQEFGFPPFRLTPARPNLRRDKK